MQKLDLKKTHPDLYRPSKARFSVVEVPSMAFLMVDGQGRPGSQPFQQAVQALYGMAYTLKFLSKAERELDFGVMPLEGLWWVEGEQPFHTAPGDDWRWRLMIRQPEHITPAMVEQARQTLQAKKDPPALPLLRFATYHEGLAVQILYVGPYDQEGPTLERMAAFIAQQGLVAQGKHHEIYLSDPNRTAPERLRTILRQPVGEGKSEAG